MGSGDLFALTPHPKLCPNVLLPDASGLLKGARIEPPTLVRSGWIVTRHYIFGTYRPGDHSWDFDGNRDLQMLHSASENWPVFGRRLTRGK